MYQKSAMNLVFNGISDINFLENQEIRKIILAPGQFFDSRVKTHSSGRTSACAMKGLIKNNVSFNVSFGFIFKNRAPSEALQ